MRYLMPTSVGILFALGGSLARAGDIQVGVSISGQITPGVYGQVQLGSSPPPPVVYAQPTVIEPPPVGVAPPAPIYLHVPPGHAKDWRHHCHEYHACNRPVYFVKSAEYEPGYARGHEKHEWQDRDHDRDHHEHGRDDDHHHDEHEHHPD